MSEIWERLPEETNRAFGAFIYYRELLPHVRSIRNAAIISLDHKLGDTLNADELRKVRNRKTRWDRHSLHNDWPLRATAWDDHLDHVRRGDRIENVRNMGTRHADVGRAVISAGIAALNQIVGVRRLGEPSDRIVLAFIAEGAKIERAAYGLNVNADELDERRASPQDVPRDILEQSPEVAAAAARFALASAIARREAETRV